MMMYDDDDDIDDDHAVSTAARPVCQRHGLFHRASSHPRVSQLATIYQHSAIRPFPCPIFSHDPSLLTSLHILEAVLTQGHPPSFTFPIYSHLTTVWDPLNFILFFPKTQPSISRTLPLSSSPLPMCCVCVCVYSLYIYVCVCSV